MRIPTCVYVYAGIEREWERDYTPLGTNSNQFGTARLQAYSRKDTGARR